MSDDRKHRPGDGPTGPESPNPTGSGGLDDARLEAALAGLSALEPDEEPRAEFRDRLRVQFAAGSVPPGTYDRAVPPKSAWRSVWPSLVAAAAVLALVLAANVANRGPAWQAIGFEGEGYVEIAGNAYPPQRLITDPGLLGPGSTVRVPDGLTLSMRLPDLYVLQAAPGSEFTLPNSPGKWIQRTSHFSVKSGEVRVTTGADFAGNRVLIQGPDAEVAILGTTIAVIGREDGTCLCVLEGEAMMTPHGGKPVMVPQGMRRVIFRDPEAEPEQVPIDGMERMKLQMLRDAHPVE